MREKNHSSTNRDTRKALDDIQQRLDSIQVRIIMHMIKESGYKTLMARNLPESKSK